MSDPFTKMAGWHRRSVRSGPVVRTNKHRGRGTPRTRSRSSGSRSTPAIRFTERNSRRCSRVRSRSAAPSSTTLATGSARTGQQLMSESAKVRRQYGNGSGGLRSSRRCASPSSRGHEGPRDAPRRLRLLRGRAPPLPRCVREETGDAPHRALVRLSSSPGACPFAHRPAEMGDVPVARYARGSSRCACRRRGSLLPTAPDAKRRSPREEIVVEPRGPARGCVLRLSGGALVLPVRLPAAPSNHAVLDHHLSNPEKWHKIDLVRRRDPNAEGGWRYEAHLMVLTERYASPATKTRRERAALETSGRSVGIDVNVSNITIASHVDGEDLRVTRVARDAGQRESARARARKERRRQRRLERSRRASNPEQYQLSSRQQERARRREAAGLPPQSVVPRGQRKSRADGKPLQAFRKDHLSARYRAERAAQAADSASAAQARRDHARHVAGAHVLRHGFRATVEDCNLSAWARLWGRALFAFSPGTLLDAIRGEAIAVAKQAGVQGGIWRASTNTTALSQHCLCGRRVAKSLGERVHSCPGCGLTGDRDAVSATLAAYVAFTDPDVPSTAVVDFARSRASLRDSTRQILRDTLLDFAARGRQDAPSESTAHSAPDGSSAGKTGRTPHPLVVARRRVGGAAHSTPDETGASQTTPERVRARPNMSQTGGAKVPPLRDSS